MRWLGRSAWLMTVVLIINAPLSAAPLDSLAKKLAAGASALGNKKIAVLTFPYHDEKISSGSRLISERLTTCLVGQKGVRVLERNLIGELLKERRLAESGIIDPRSLKAIGKIFDADAIVTGTLIDLPNDKTEINARLIRTDTGEVLSAGRVTVERTWNDAPCEIIIRRPVAPQATRAPAPPDDLEIVEEETTAKTTGKTLKLSNENFPPGRRLYLKSEPSQLFRYPMTSSARPPTSDDRDDGFAYAPPVSVYYRPATGSHGYNGTDAKPLPPTHLMSHPLGSVHFDHRTVIRRQSDSAK
jgi:hypothetical protein